MDFLSPVGELFLFIWGPVSRQISYLKRLNHNMEKLTSETQELKCKRDEIQAEFQAAISVGKNPVRQVDNWLIEVSNIETQVDSMLLQFSRRRSSCLNCCSADHLSRFKLGKKVVKRLKDVQNLKGKGVFDTVAVSPPRPRVLEMQTSLPRGQQSTSEQTLEEIWQCLHDEESRIICVFGMGGIGKTTLMKSINNRLIGTHDFDVVIWVTVSKDLNLGLIQAKIGNKLGMIFCENEEKRDRLFTRLKNVRYMLILDDLWQSFSLDQVGIPKPDEENRCKIAITTRSVAVSNAMEADRKIRVKTLTSEEAWNLFCEKSGNVVLSPEIRPVAEKVVEECGGLPLAIKTVGRAMHGKDKTEVWQNALRGLKGSAPEVPGMERDVFLPLKLSYDCLEDDKIKLCFLYCSIFPVDYEIKIDEIVTYWAMEEGLLDNVNNLEEASNKGHDILERIKDACLLEEGHRGDKYVRMHDLLRDLAIWITSPSSSSLSSSSSNQGSKFLVKAGEGLVQPPEEKMWEGIERISLMRNEIKEFQIKPNCPTLISLFLQGNGQLHTIHTSFFELMPKLQVLDLSDTRIESLPASFSLLGNLRVLILRSCMHLVEAPPLELPKLEVLDLSNTHIGSLPVSLSLLVNLGVLILRFCKYLLEVPPLEQLTKLQLLDLSHSNIRSLPQGIANLVKLKQLNLSHMNILAEIPHNIISKLSCLEELNMLGLKHANGAILRKVATFTSLTSLSIDVPDFHGIRANDAHHSRWPVLRELNVHVGSKNFWFADYDKQMNICGCDYFPHGIEELVKQAEFLRFDGCTGITCLSRLVGGSKSLKWLKVILFSGLECIVDWRDLRDDALQCLEQLLLHTLPNLEKVFNGGMPPQHTHLQQLSQIVVVGCPKLRCLFSSYIIEHLHQLEELQVRDCDGMEEIIEGDMLPENSLPRLRLLLLDNLQKLSSICIPHSFFTSLKVIRVVSCPKLKKLPLLCSSIQEIQGQIIGERDQWWDGLEWEDENSKSLYTRIYVEPQPDQRKNFLFPLIMEQGNMGTPSSST
ncbi:probable disease resistance protein At1g61300 [Magnolia sinica]|uniref:probable disease resistance protein At1g61300 n=1 Tax=Magnolia sinica TaxID=86752 RepID=UPI002659726F|nr:probable disease resistance protein At1g61300 [Magnolia sinica]